MDERREGLEMANVGNVGGQYRYPEGFMRLLAFKARNGTSMGKRHI
jgi:hypothetical protein